MKIIKSKKFKKIFLGCLAGFAIATPIAMTSCSTNNNPSNTSTTDTTNSGTENYSKEDMVNKGTNDQQMNNNQKSRQSNKAQSSNLEFQAFLSSSDSDVLNQGLKTYSDKGLEFEEKFYNTYEDEYVTLVSSNNATEDEFKDFWQVIAQAYKDNGLEYGFVAKHEYDQKYKSSFETYIKDNDKNVLLNTGSSNYSYTSFIYHSLYIAIWGDVLIHEYLEKQTKTQGEYIVPALATWFYENLDGNLKTEINLYLDIYNAL